MEQRPQPPVCSAGLDASAGAGRVRKIDALGLGGIRSIARRQLTAHHLEGSEETVARWVTGTDEGTRHDVDTDATGGLGGEDEEIELGPGLRHPLADHGAHDINGGRRTRP
jgi:hypothetical protein